MTHKAHFTSIPFYGIEYLRDTKIYANDLTRLKSALAKVITLESPTYQQIQSFSPRTSGLHVRKSIQEFVESRAALKLTMHQEAAWATTVGSIKGLSLADQAKRIHRNILSSGGRFRRFPVYIRHFPEVEIEVPSLDSPIHRAVHEDGTDIAEIIGNYLILVSVHPFSDANGRVARIFFNQQLRAKVNLATREATYLPLAEIFRRSDGEYEELLARAAMSGDYEEAYTLLIRLLLDYCNFRLTKSALKPSALATASRYLLSPPSHDPQINEVPPFVLDISESSLRREMVETIDGVELFLASIHAATMELESIATVSYCITALILSAKEMRFSKSAIFVLQTKEVALLLKRSRELKEKYAGQFALKLVPLTDNPIANAKLTLSLSHIECFGQKHEPSCLILLTGLVTK